MSEEKSFLGMNESEQQAALHLSASKIHSCINALNEAIKDAAWIGLETRIIMDNYTSVVITGSHLEHPYLLAKVSKEI